MQQINIKAVDYIGALKHIWKYAPVQEKKTSGSRQNKWNDKAKCKHQQKRKTADIFDTSIIANDSVFENCPHFHGIAFVRRLRAQIQI